MIASTICPIRLRREKGPVLFFWLYAHISQDFTVNNFIWLFLTAITLSCKHITPVQQIQQAQYKKTGLMLINSFQKKFWYEQMSTFLCHCISLLYRCKYEGINRSMVANQFSPLWKSYFKDSLSYNTILGISFVRPLKTPRTWPGSHYKLATVDYRQVSLTTQVTAIASEDSFRPC